MHPAEYAEHDGVGLAGLIRAGEVSAAEVQAAAVAAVASVQPHLNAVVDGPWETPLDHAPQGPFAGVPFVIKDILLHAAGTPTHMGSRMLAHGLVHQHDTELMRRFRVAGLATIATTRTPEFALSVGTEPVFGGPTHNPWDRTRSAGGSSGGTAALVAAGAVPLGHANDGAGSIRIPAAHTGLVGLKPSRGRVPLGPDQQEIMYGLATELALTRTVRDTAAVLDAVSGAAPGEKFTLDAPARTFTSELGADPGRLRIALHLDSWTTRATDPGVAEQIRQVAATLAELGHHVEYAEPAIDWATFRSALTTTWCAGTAAAVYPLADALGVEVDTTHVERTTLACAEHGRQLNPVDLAGAFAVYTAVSQEVGGFLRGWDLWLTPTAIAPPPPLGHFDADGEHTAQEWVARCTEFYPYLAIFNVTGTPALTLPAGLVDGLPVGAQLAAPMGQEARLLQVAAQLEQARPWAGQLPAVHVAAPAPKAPASVTDQREGVTHVR